MKKYKVLIDLFYPTDPKILKALVTGENLPMKGRWMKHVKAGSIVSDIPAVSIPGLLEAGRIEEVKDGA